MQLAIPLLAVGLLKPPSLIGQLRGVVVPGKSPPPPAAPTAPIHVKIDGHWPKDALKIIENGEWDDRFN